MQDTSRKEAGDLGERSALNHLIDKGLRLVLRNYRCNGGELDLVMLDGSVLVLVEVRVRHHATFGGAAASVTSKKQKRIILAAKHLLMTHRELGRYRARFDVVAIDSGKVQWIKDAFRT